MGEPPPHETKAKPKSCSRAIKRGIMLTVHARDSWALVFFADHDRRRIGIVADDLRHDRGIGDAKASDAVHLEPRIDDGVVTVPSGRLIAEAKSL